MPSLWDGKPGRTGRDLLARRRRLLGRISEAGLDHVMLGDHVMFQGGLGNDGMIDAASALTANEESPGRCGGRSDAALRRAGRLGDGWLGIWVSARRFAEAVEAVAAHAKDAARPEVEWRHGMTFWCGMCPRHARRRGRAGGPLRRGRVHDAQLHPVRRPCWGSER